MFVFGNDYCVAGLIPVFLHPKILGLVFELYRNKLHKSTGAALCPSPTVAEGPFVWLKINCFRIQSPVTGHDRFFLLGMQAQLCYDVNSMSLFLIGSLI